MKYTKNSGENILLIHLVQFVIHQEEKLLRNLNNFRRYQDIVPAVEYSGETEQYFDRLIIEGNENTSVVLVNQLIESVRYNLKPRSTLLQIKSEILTILIASERYTLL